MIDKELFRKTEELLSSYKTLVAEIKNLDIEIKEIEYIGCSAIGYEERTQATNKFNSSVENEVIERDRQIKKLEELKFIKESIVKRIDNALESLEDRLKEIIKLKYFDKMNNNKIAAKLDLTEEWICKLNKDALKQIHNIILNIT